MELEDREATNTTDAFDPELLSTVSHELRSPLASIKGYTATLLRHERHLSREERHEFLLAIKQSSDRMEGIIDRLLELSELEMGYIQLHRTPTNLAHLAQEAIIAREDTTQNRMAIAQQHQVSLYIGGDTEQLAPEALIASVDRQRIREVLDHLLENALLYSEQGEPIEVLVRPISGPQIRRGTGLPRPLSPEESVDWQQVEQAPTDTTTTMYKEIEERGQPMIEIQVRDFGIGIPTEHLDSIFTRFHRVDTSLTRAVNGLGLGLAICKYIVTLHNGLIWVESQPGQGSTFHVCLPVDTPPGNEK